MGLILDLAVVALALAVIGSLALLSWTLAVNAVRAVREGRDRVILLQRNVDEAEDRLRDAATRASAAIGRLEERTPTAYGDPFDR